MDPKAFRVEIIRPALKLSGLWSENGEALMLGTALAESGLRHLRQIGGGPAIGFYQVEPATHDDVLRYLRRSDNKLLKQRILSASLLEDFPDSRVMLWNLRYATLIARVKYWMRPEPLPYYEDIEALGRYWKSFYNTSKGAGTVEHFIKAWQGS